MTRKEKYKDTKNFHYYNANPHGRITGDCVIRAIATATGQKYADIVQGLAEVQIKTGYDGQSPEGFGRYLERLGWTKHKQPRKADGTKYTGAEFCEEFGGACVANIGGHHAVCVKGGRIWDIWDSSEGCIGNYWAKD